MNFKKGTTVSWVSQSGGNYKKKTGKIVRKITKSEHPILVHREEFKNHKRMFDGWNIPYPTKNQCAYLIEIIPTPNSVPRLYMPDPRKLTTE